jgi:hypothetical protein
VTNTLAYYCKERVVVQDISNLIPDEILVTHTNITIITIKTIWNFFLQKMLKNSRLD